MMVPGSVNVLLLQSFGYSCLSRDSLHCFKPRQFLQDLQWSSWWQGHAWELLEAYSCHPK